LGSGKYTTRGLVGDVICNIQTTCKNLGNTRTCKQHLYIPDMQLTIEVPLQV
jgi:hypothetical protein